jgi:SpoVK/Ycf46/Vps4 family AAA+-type ATPase
MDEILVELDEAGIMKETPDASLSLYLGGWLAPPPEKDEATASLVGKKARTGGKAANTKRAVDAAAADKRHPAGPVPLPSMARVRQALSAACSLPLASFRHVTPDRCPATLTSILLFGPEGSGKSLLAAAIAGEAGATLFDLSPAATKGIYPGREADSMVHMVFKAAKELAPSVVLIDEVEKVFVRDGVRGAGFAAADEDPGTEPPNRILGRLKTELAALKPGDGVLVVSCSSAPQACVASDEAALAAAFPARLRLPMPDAASRRQILEVFTQGVSTAAGAPLWGTKRREWAALSLAAELCEGCTPGQLKKVGKAHVFHFFTTFSFVR